MARSVPTPCPDVSILERLLLGCTTADETELLEAHFAVCDRCVLAADAQAAEDALSRAMVGAQAMAVSPHQELIDVMTPLLKRLRSENTTAPPMSSAALQGKATPNLLGPALSSEELGRLGPYRVLRELGAGGMGVVYLAEDPELRRQIALKAIRPELLARPDMRERFLREAQAVAAVAHDHIVTIHHVGEQEGVPYLAMPLLRGQTVEERLQQADGPLPLDELLRIGRQSAEGLAAAHERGLVHRDIKPSNLFVEEPGRVKILDFGLAQVMQEEAAGRLPEGTVVGTPAYMSPEQGSGKPVDAQSDLFSLGCVLYRMATGRPAFHGPDVISTLMSVALDQPPKPCELNPRLPAALVELIERLLAKQREQRPPSARFVADRLRDIERQRARAALPWHVRYRWLMGCAVLLLVAGFMAWVMQPTETVPLPPEPGEVSFAFDEEDPRIVVQRGEEPEQVLDLKAQPTFALEPGDYTVRPKVERPGRWLDPDRIHVAAGGKSEISLRLVGEVRRHRYHTLPVLAVAFSPVRRSLLALSASMDQAVVGWNAGTKDDPWILGEHRSPVHCVAFSGDGRRAASGSGGKGGKPDFSIRIWDIEKREQLVALTGHPSWVTAVAFAADGLHLLSGGADGTVYLWDLQQNAIRHRLQGHDALRIRAVAFSPDGKQVLSCGGDKSILLWDPDQGTLRRRLLGHTETVSGAAFAPDGARIASSGWDGTIRVWDLKTGGHRAIRADKEMVHGLAWSPDGKRLLSAGEDGTVRLWDVEHEAEIVRFTGHKGKVSSVAFSADGRYALSGGSDCTVRLWALPK